MNRRRASASSGGRARNGQSGGAHAAGRSSAPSRSGSGSGPAARQGSSAQRRPRTRGQVEVVYPSQYRREPSPAYTPYRSRRDEDDESSRSIFRILLVTIASLVYWPVAIVGVVSPFMADFNPGGLEMWQAVFSRFWLAFVLLGAVYAAITNLGHFRDLGMFQTSRKGLRIVLFLLIDAAVSFVLLRIICLF